MSKTASPPIRIGISSCLLGEQVRYDGGHKRDAYLVDTLGHYLEWVPVCPEVEMGLGTPRDTLRLVRIGEAIRMVMPKTGADHTEGMRSFSSRRVRALAGQDLCGYVLKKGSPSCGMERVRVFDAHGVPTKSGRGLFATALLERFPDLPVEEEGRLADPRLRENFIERVFAYHRLRLLFAGKWKRGDLVRFHTTHKLLLAAHSPRMYGNLGRLVANARALPRSTLSARYAAEFMSALRVIATPKRHASVLQHMAGYFRRQLDDGSRRELLSLIEDYRQGLVPLVVPLTLVRHYFRKFQITYLQGQVYLEPHPKELMLRNHV
ncbi:MAG: DUF523 and DUF1722 domain-containing protein [Acidobacteriia bacterium]|nr:DUF523 and DUF1722 domain-containing protein [Terriglobia bacterium]